MSFGQAELEQLIQESIKSYRIDPWEYNILENLEESETEWPTGQLEDGKGRLTEEDEEELEEVSSMAGGSVEGGLGGGAWSKPKDEDVVSDKWKKLREIVRNKAIEIIRNNTKTYMEQENRLREYIQNILRERKSIVTSNPHHMTGINVLQTLLANIIPTTEPDYKSLTTSKEQREAYKIQLMHSIENILNQAGVNKIAGTDQDNDGDLDEVGEQSSKTSKATKKKDRLQPVKVVTDENPFIDIYGDNDKVDEADEVPEEPEQDPGVVQNIDPTGRAKALETVGKIQKQIQSEFSKLSDQRDVEAFTKYMMINLQMYMDKFEDEVGSSLSQIDAEPSPEDVVDTGDGLSPDELNPGEDENDPFMPNDLEKEWRDAENTMVEFYSTSGGSGPRFGPDVENDELRDY